ncbi:MAG: M56 family metallopeptidase [Steroidobacteraceae bacterium]
MRRSAQPLLISGYAALDLRASQQVRAPASFGSTILLPTDWQSWQPLKLRAVIAHENAHIQQHDCYRLWLAALYGAIFWLNPCAIWLRRRLAVLAELDSDEAAVAITGDRIGYAEVLLNIATDAQPPWAILGMARPSTLSPRLTRLLESDMSSMKLRHSSKWLLMSAVALTMATAVCGATAPLVLSDAQDSSVTWVVG